MFEKKVQGEIRELHRQLKAILDEDRNERVMIFTDDREIQELAAQMGGELTLKSEPHVRTVFTVTLRREMP